MNWDWNTNEYELIRAEIERNIKSIKTSSTL